MLILAMHQLMTQTSLSKEVSLDWLLEDYKYIPPVVHPVSMFPKEWTIFDIDDSDFATAKVKADSKADKEKKAKMKKETQAMKAMKK
jgi:hypothetical protein